MTERLFRLFIGVCILTALYFDLPRLMTGLIAVLLFEGFTNWRVPVIASRLRCGSNAQPSPEEMLWPTRALCKIGFDAVRAWRLMVASMLILTYLLYYDKLWFMPWFMGFAILGSGLSGVCPMLISLKLIGFR